MKRILCVCLVFCMLCSVSITTYAANIETNDESFISTNETFDTFVSKDMKTGEITTPNYTAADKTQTDGSDISVGNFTESWFPNTTISDNESESSTISPSSLIGEDNRTNVTDTTVMPYSAICYIEIKWPDGSTSIGTAFMIYDDLALTAGHCVYSSDNGGWATNVKLWPGKDGYGFWNNPFGTTEAASLHTATQWTESEDEEYDWALLELEDAIGNETGWFGIGWSSSSLTGTAVTISGYPGEYQYYQYKMSDEITRCSTTKLYYNVIDTTGGQSGSPIYTSNQIVYGIHCYGSPTENSGTRITEWRFDHFCSFMD